MNAGRSREQSEQLKVNCNRIILIICEKSQTLRRDNDAIIAKNMNELNVTSHRLEDQYSTALAIHTVKPNGAITHLSIFRLGHIRTVLEIILTFI